MGTPLTPTGALGPSKGVGQWWIAPEVILELVIGPNLTLETRLYRYVGLESFLALIESASLRLTNVNRWEDPGEAIPGKFPTRNQSGELQQPLYSFHQDVYGSSWSRLQESDAMWRIYSPNRSGIQIATSVAKLQRLAGIRRGLIGEVMYFATESELVANVSADDDSLAVALHKRSAFQHEQEVRLLTHADFVEGVRPESTHVDLAVDPVEFIERVVLDPRASDWYVDAVVRYCARVGLRVKPSKSSLYEPEPHTKMGIEKRWVPLPRSERGQG